MVRFDDAAWVGKAKKRKAYRDYYRDRFFNEFGVQRHKTHLDHDISESSQLPIFDKLTEVSKTQNVDTDQVSAIDLGKLAISTFGIGSTGASVSRKTQDELLMFGLTRLRSFFYSPVFFDE